MVVLVCYFHHFGVRNSERAQKPQFGCSVCQQTSDFSVNASRNAKQSSTPNYLILLVVVTQVSFIPNTSINEHTVCSSINQGNSTQCHIYWHIRWNYTRCSRVSKHTGCNVDILLLDYAPTRRKFLHDLESLPEGRLQNSNKVQRPHTAKS